MTMESEIQRTREKLLFGGLNTRVSEIDLPGFMSPDMRNVDLHPVGSLQKRLGFTALEELPGSGAIDRLALLDNRTDSRQFIYAARGTALYRSELPGLAAWETPALPGGRTLAAGSKYQAAEAGDATYNYILYICDGNGIPILARGLTDPATDLAVMAAGSYGTGAAGTGTAGYDTTKWAAGGWPRGMRLIGSSYGTDATRMFAWGFDNDPDRIDYSELGVPSNWLKSDVDREDVVQPELDGGHFFGLRGVGGRVVNVVDMQSYIVVFKERVTILISGDPGDSEGFGVVKVMPYGLAGDAAWTKIGNDLTFWSYGGPKILSALERYDDLRIGDIDVEVRSLVTGVAPSGYNEICCYNDRENMRVVWFMPASGSATNNLGLVMYYDEPRRWSVYDGEIVKAGSIVTVEATEQNAMRFYAGRYDGSVVRLQSTNSDNGSDIDAYYVTKWFDMGAMSDMKRSVWMDLVVGNAGDTDLVIENEIDLSGAWIETAERQRAIGSQGARWDVAKWDVDKWDTVSRAFTRFSLDYNYNMIRFRFTSEGTHGFSLLGWYIEAETKGPRG